MNPLSTSPDAPSLRVPLPPGCLDLPFTHERRQVMRYEAGLYVDPLLLRLTRVSGAIDRSLARGLHGLRSSRGYVRLGYARFADYTRERMDLSVRTAQQMVRLAGGLERLPLLDAALEQGTVTWTAALLVAGVARPEDEARWVERAQRLTVRQLRQEVARTAATAADPSGEVNHSAEESTSGETAEYMLAELLSALPGSPPDGAARSGCRPPVVGGRGIRPRCPAPDWPAGAAQLVRDAPSREERSRIEQLLGLIGTEPGTDDPFELDGWLRAVIAARIELELDLARLLRLFHSFDLARQLGFDSFSEYVAERLGISKARAGFLVRLDHKLAKFHRVERAVRRGQIGTVAALLVCRVARRHRTERAWVERARCRTVVRLRKEVEWAERERGSSWVGVVMPPAPGPLPSELDAITEELLRASAATETGKGVDGDEESGGSDDCGGGDCGGNDDGGSSGAGADGETFAHGMHWGRPVRVAFRLRESALGLWEEVKARLDGLDACPVISDERVLYEAALAFLSTYLPLWVAEVEHGDRVAVRERFHCAAPGCTHRCGSAHHIRFRSRGGTDDPSNLSFLCHVHHLEMIHRLGSVRISGRAPDRLVFELGIRPDGTALEVYFNEERVEGGDLSSVDLEGRADTQHSSRPWVFQGPLGETGCG